MNAVWRRVAAQAAPSCIFISLLLTWVVPASAQVNPDQAGAWYMYFFNKKFEGSQFGVQGDYQFRNWNMGGDLEQLLLRTGVTYKPLSADVLLTAGYAYIASGAFGDSRETAVEHRIYQEALLPQRVGNRIFLTHRFRYEQRFVENQDFRTRYRYNLFVNVALNKTKMEKNTLYLALYNEIFINGERNIGQGRSVPYFDRNRLYAGLGFGLSNAIRLQLGWMDQTTNDWQKGQFQLSLHHNF